MPRAPRCTAIPSISRQRRIHTSSFSFKAPSRSRASNSSTFFTPHQPRPRTFTHRSSLLLISRAILRPQLPFLHPATRSPSPTFSAALKRYITTEKKAYWKATLRWHLRFQAYAWPIIALLYLAWVGTNHVQWEHKHPTPRDWSFWSRWNLRTAQHVEMDEEAKVYRILTDWQVVGVFYKSVLERLESARYDGTNLIPGETLVDAVGLTGFDISMKSEPWRRGYYQTLMGLGRVAENLDGLARRKEDSNSVKRLFPWESIPGPSNPRPKPLPFDKQGRNANPPTEMEAEAAFDQPEKYYMKILTTRGFDNGQRLDAALGYAVWCDFKGLTDTASDMYDWALDIAAGGLPDGADGVVDIKTGVIQKGKEEMVTRNLMKATTALAVHHARIGKVKEALPMFLSVLRARKTLPAAPAYSEPDQKLDDPIESRLKSLFAGFKDMLFDTPYPAMPPSGDTRPFHTLKEACEEVGLMTYIGEILFATSQSEREKGLSWTRDSVEAAEAVMWVMDETNEQEGREKCRECLETGLKNWRAMAKQMEALSLGKQQEAENKSGFLGTGWGKSTAVEKAHKEVDKWRQEEEQIDLRTQKTLPLVKPLKPARSGWMTV